MQYFSEREIGELSRESEEIGNSVWRGVLATIRVRVVDGSFGASYPAICPDGTYVSGTNVRMLDDAMRAELPRLVAYEESDVSSRWQSTLDILQRSDSPPSTLDILDLIEFSWKSIGEPTSIGFHPFFSHAHIVFDRTSGRERFRDDVEIIFRRNRIAYALTEAGRIKRLTPLVFRDALAESDFETGEKELDLLLSTAQRKFLDSHPDTRREGLEALWDAWERLQNAGW